MRVITHSLKMRACLAAFFALALVTAATLAFPGAARASFGYTIPKQQDQLTINPDGSVTLIRYFEFAVSGSSTDSGTEIWAGLPTSGTKVSSVVDQDGKSVSFQTRSSDGQYVVTMTGFAIKPGTQKGFTVTATVSDLVFRDDRNAGYVTMQYMPGWWSSPVAVQDIAVVLPAKVEKAEIRTGSRLWDGIAQTDSGAYVVTWQFKDLKANEKVNVNVGVPDKYVTLPTKEAPPPAVNPPIPGWTPRTSPSPSPFAAMGGFVFAAVIIGLGLGLIARARREEYSSPQVSMEGVGVNETLEPVEASVLLRQPPEKTLTLLLFSMVKKGVVRVYPEEPLRVAIQYERDLTEAERLYLEAIDRATGAVDGAKLAPCFKHLVTSVNEKMRPYCRRDTEEFYRGVIRRAWDELTASATPELKLTQMDRDLLWLMQDEEKMRASGDLFPQDQEASDLPDWWTIGFMFARPYAYPFYMWPGAIYGHYQDASGGMLGDEERQSMRRISEEIWAPAHAPAGPATPGVHRGGGGYHGGFTPPSCACACACVSCACACACAGGGGCT